VGNPYLFFAYAIAWLLFGVYAWSLSRRQAQLRRDLDELKMRLQGRNTPADAV
jgi:CcmD family protein